MDGFWRLVGNEGRLSSRSMALMARNLSGILLLCLYYSLLLTYPVTATACSYTAENDQHMQIPEMFSSPNGKGLVNQIRGAIVTPAKKHYS